MSHPVQHFFEKHELSDLRAAFEFDENSGALIDLKAIRCHRKAKNVYNRYVCMPNVRFIHSLYKII